MMKALLVAGASVAFGQSCYLQPVTNCTGVTVMAPMANTSTTCALTSFCARNSTVGSCDTSMMTCSGNACGTGSMIANQSSCSKCVDQCAQATTSAACTASAMNSACYWYSACGNAPTPMTFPCSGTTASTCTSEAGCFWLDYSTTVCGQTTRMASCNQCNSSAVVDSNTRSALSANVGKTCTWPAMAPYGASSITINAISQSSDTTNCPAMMGPMAGDPATITTAASKGMFGQQGVQSSQTATCATQSSGVAALIPSLALMGLIAVVA